MKKLFALIVFLTVPISAAASPLLFKISKVISTDGKLELGSFEESKYRQIRIGVQFAENQLTNCFNLQTPAFAEIELRTAQRSFDRNKGLFDQGTISKANLENYPDVLRAAQAGVKNAGIIRVRFY